MKLNSEVIAAQPAAPRFVSLETEVKVPAGQALVISFAWSIVAGLVEE